MDASPGIKTRPQWGFALVSTLLMLVLLSVIAVGLLSLSAVTLRTSSAGTAMEAARANARLGLTLAIGKLQTLSGPDTRITAPAELTDPEAGRVTGVWRSWEGTDHDKDGLPLTPDLQEKLAAGPDASGDGRFLGWLVSGAEEKQAPQSAPDVAPAAGKVALVGSGTVGDQDPKNKISLAPTPVSTGRETGAMAWWIGAENQKARLHHQEKSLAMADDVDRMKAVSLPDPEIFELENTEALERIVTYRSHELLGRRQETARHFHDLSGFSSGLLTNSATGGWRKDLSLMSESWATLPEKGLPFFTLKPGETTAASKARASHPPSMLIYPWAVPLEGPGTTQYWNLNGAVVSWNALVDFMQQYRQMASANESGAIRFLAEASNQSNAGNQNRRRDKVRRFPTIARIQWVYSYAATKLDAERYRADLVVNPVVTVWNPYNFELAINSLEIEVEESAPVTFSFRLGAKTTVPVTLSRLAFANGRNIALRLKLEDPSGQHLFLPGETRVFSPAEPIPKDFSNRDLQLTAGYRTRGGFRFSKLINGTGELIGTAADRLSAEMTFDGNVRLGKNRVGIFMDVNGGPAYSGDSVKITTYRMEIDRSIVQQENYYPPISHSETPEASLATVEASNQPFGSSTFGFRMATDVEIPSKGLLQTSPLVSHTELGVKAEGALGVAAAGVHHPVNSPYDFRFRAHRGWSDSTLPQADPDTANGFIVSGQDASNGLTRCVISAVPLRPVLSLVELSDFDLRNNNPVPPFATNLIGNSHAQPLLAADTVRRNELQYDDSFIANHLLFDDWFVSGIAPRPSSWGDPGGSPADTLVEFASGKRPLGNLSYRPAPALVHSTPEEIRKIANAPDSYLRIASRLEVTGMFNVNSISIKAWKALLGSGIERKVPVMQVQGGTSSIGSGDEIDHPVSRFPVAADGLPGDDSTSGFFPEANDFAGHRALTEDQIERLAGFIVEQVRRRGPFLSLAEFVNRQLGRDQDLALHGALEAALAKLRETGGAANPSATLESMSRRITAEAMPSARADYLFPEAAKGSSAYGSPGWIRQADLLRPLAPILSVRDDSFVIRSYGESSRAGKIIARAWCEAVVRRMPDLIHAGETPPEEAVAPVFEQALRFGRRYEIISFRWLAPEEV